VRAVHEAAKLPVMVGGTSAPISREDLAAAGARVMLQGHQPVAAAVKAVKDVYTHLYNGGAAADLKDKIASAGDIDKLVNAAAYKAWQRDYLGVKGKG